MTRCTSTGSSGSGAEVISAGYVRVLTVSDGVWRGGVSGCCGTAAGSRYNGVHRLYRQYRHHGAGAPGRERSDRAWTVMGGSYSGGTR